MDDTGLTLNDDGTVDVQLDDKVLHLPRPKIRQLLALQEAIEWGDGQFRTLNEGNIPEDLHNAASQLAIADLGRPSGSAEKRKREQAAIAERALTYVSQLWQTRILMSSNNPYPVVWQRVIKELTDQNVPVDDMPAWMMSPIGLMGLSGHWMAVPLRHGPTTNRADAEPDQTTSTP